MKKLLLLVVLVLAVCRWSIFLESRIQDQRSKLLVLGMIVNTIQLSFSIAVKH